MLHITRVVVGVAAVVDFIFLIVCSQNYGMQNKALLTREQCYIDKKIKLDHNSSYHVQMLFVTAFSFNFTMYIGIIFCN